MNGTETERISRMRAGGTGCARSRGATLFPGELLRPEKPETKEERNGNSPGTPASLEDTTRSGPSGSGIFCDRGCRVLNVLVATIALIAAAPLMLVIAALIKLTSPGPVIFRQRRVGIDRRGRSGRDRGDRRRRIDLGGRLFTMYKFRTMRNDPADDRQVWATPDDPRITAVGRVLRKFRLDELPQLFNVLRGEMNIVGPRPEQPEIFQEIREKVDGYEQRQKVLPGITGWAQVNHHYDRCIEDVRRKVQLDLEYIEGRSPLKDLKILARTLPVMVARKGAV